MSSSKTGNRPRSWFGIKLGGRSPKPDPDKTGSGADKESNLKSAKEGKTAKISPKKNKISLTKNSSKGNKATNAVLALKSTEDPDVFEIRVENENAPYETSKKEECAKVENVLPSETTKSPSRSPHELPNSTPGKPSTESNQPVTFHNETALGNEPKNLLLQTQISKEHQEEKATATSKYIAAIHTTNDRALKSAPLSDTTVDRANYTDRDFAMTPALATEHHLQHHQQQKQQQQLGQQQFSISTQPRTQTLSTTQLTPTSHPVDNGTGATATPNSETTASSKLRPVSSTSCTASSILMTGAASSVSASSARATTTTNTTTTTSSSSSATAVTTPTVKIPPTPRYNLNFLGDLQSKHKFSLAVCKQNDVANSAIQSLDCLNEQIVQYILTAYTSPASPSPVSPTPPTSPNSTGPANDGDTQPGRVPISPDSITSANLNLSSPAAHASMVIIRRLLVDAQTRFRRMVEDNRKLAAHIDSSIQSANQEVSLLRAELASTNRKLHQIGSEDMARVEAATQVELSCLEGPESLEEKEASYREDVQALTKANEQLVEEYRHLLQDHKSLSLANDELKVDNDRLQGECSRLEAQFRSLTMDYDVLVREVKAELSPGQQGQSQTSACQKGHGQDPGGQQGQGSDPAAFQQEEVSKSEACTSAAPRSGPPVAPRQSYGELKLELIQSRQELNRAKEMLHGMKCDRKRLKGEKLDLLGQIKQLYTTLEDKETELRDFIKNYESRVKESDEMIKQLAKEKAKAERDKWDIVTRAKDASERAVALKAQLDDKDMQLTEVKKKLSSQDNESVVDGSTTTSISNNNASMIIDEVDDDIFMSVNDNGFSTLEESSVLNCTIAGEGGDTFPQVVTPSPGSNASGSASPSGQAFRWFTQSSDLDLAQGDGQSTNAGEGGGGGGGAGGGKGETDGSGGGGGGGLLGVGKNVRGGSKKKKSNGIGGSLSRVFSRGKLRRSLILPHAEAILGDSGPKLCVLSQDNYQEKLATIEKMVGVHMREWRAHQVLAWLEITLAMPMYAQNCLTNVKSGKILLGLSDSELSAAMGVTNTMHRRKLRLAIEQHRNPDEINYIKASEMDPTWVSHRLLPDLGLPQYTQVFEEQLCDGHVLNTLTRRDLEKHFSVHRKFHQSSILHAVELMRRIDFNKEKLYHRRNLIEDKDTDLIVWTNERLVKWLRTIDLGEYSESLLESGVHGALMVLEPSFNTDSLASILGIPPSKSYITRHLSTELDKVLKPARAALDPCDNLDKAFEVTLRGKGSSSAAKGGKLGSQEKEQKTPAQEADKSRAVWTDKERRKSQEEGRALLAELLGRKLEPSSA